MRSRVIILRIKHNAQNLRLLKECNSFAHQTHTDSLAIRGRMNGNAYEIARFFLERIELIANNVAIQLSYDKIGVSRSNILERQRVVAPEVLETCPLDGN